MDMLAQSNNFKIKVINYLIDREIYINANYTVL